MAEVDRTWLGNEKNLVNISYKAWAEVREAAVLTTGYVDSDYVDMGEFDEINVGFDVLVTPTLIELDYKIYGSYDTDTWYLNTADIVSSGIIQSVPCEYETPLASGMISTEPWFVSVPFPYQYAKVAVKCVGSPVGSLCAVVIGGAF